MNITHSGYDDTLESIFQQYQAIRSKIIESGIRVHPACRFSLYASEIERAISAQAGKLAIDKIDWVSLAEGWRDIAELRTIVFSPTIFSNSIPFFNSILGGNVTPSDDGANSPARDKQFELYIASILEQIGFLVTLEEPDIRFEHNSQIFSIAAKRVKSEARIRERYLEAVKQIKRYSYPGFVCMSFDYIVRGPNDKLIIAANPSALVEAGETLMNQVLYEVCPQYLKESDIEEQTIGFIASFVMPCLIPSSIPGFNPAFTSQMRALYLQPSGLELCKIIGSHQIKW